MSQRLALVRGASQLRVVAAAATRHAPAPSTVAAAATFRLQSLQGCCTASTPAASVVPGRPSAAAAAFGDTVLGKRRGISTATPVLLEGAKEKQQGKEAEVAKAAPPADAAADADAPPAPTEPTPYEAEVSAASSGPDDPVPTYQNPRHHNSPDHQRVLHDEFGADESVPADAPMPPFEDGSGKVLASPELHDIADVIVNMTMVEVNELCNRIGEHFGIVEDDGAGMGGDGDGDEDGEAKEEEKVEEKTAFDLKLIAYDAKAKIKVIKEVRTMAGLGLKEAKETVEGVPKTVMKDIKKEEAEELKAKLEALGATVEIV